MCCDGNRANTACTLELTLQLGWDEQVRPCVQGPWISFPGRDLQLRINVYPVGNRRMTTTHLSAYLEILPPVQKTEWHTALDFTFVMQHPGLPRREVSWSSGPVRFVEPFAGGGRLDWGCHELLPLEVTSSPVGEVMVTAHVALQEAFVEVVHIAQLANHVSDFGFGPFRTFEPRLRNGLEGGWRWPVRICLPASATKTELLIAVARAFGKPVERLWRFSRSSESQGRLACSLPEAPRHLLVDGSTLLLHGQEEGPSDIYALLTKWTLGESSGGARQNFFRFLAEGSSGDATIPSAAYLGTGCGVRVFVKTFSPIRGLCFEDAVTVTVPSAEDVQTLLPPILAECGLPPTPTAANDGIADEWCLVWEGSPCDWYEAPVSYANDRETGEEEERLGGRLGSVSSQLVNGHGPVVQGDIVVLCPLSALPELAAMYRRQYLRRVDDFAALHAREASQVGSTSFAELCQVMDALNVDAWRLEQLLGSVDVNSGGGCALSAATAAFATSPATSAASPAAVSAATAAATAAAVAPRSLLSLHRLLPGLHPQFFCDACGTRELRGCRYNCLVCSDFDLCEMCYRTQPEVLRPKDHTGRYHDKSHRMARAWPALPATCLE